MNCTVFQRRLLASEQPEQPADEMQSHLAQCPSCRAWQCRLVQMEEHLRALPVPPSSAKADLLERLLRTRNEDGIRPHIADASPPWRSSLAPGPKERGLRKVSVAFALAASLLVFALSWWVWPHSSPSVVKRTTDDSKARLEERLTKELNGFTAKERVLRLAKLAKEVHQEAQGMTTNSERLEKWTQFYTRVVGENLMAQARMLPAAERAAVLPQVTQSLIDTESQAARLAAELRTDAPRSAASFAQIAYVSRKSEQDLRALLKL